MVIFHCYVSSPEGIPSFVRNHRYRWRFGKQPLGHTRWHTTALTFLVGKAWATKARPSSWEFRCWDPQPRKERFLVSHRPTDRQQKSKVVQTKVQKPPVKTWLFWWPKSVTRYPIEVDSGFLISLISQPTKLKRTDHFRMRPGPKVRAPSMEVCWRPWWSLIPSMEPWLRWTGLWDPKMGGWVQKLEPWQWTW